MALYAQKYDEEFKEYLPNFVESVWNLLTTVGLQVKHDQLVSTAMSFLASVAERHPNKHLFEDPAVLQSICEKVGTPHCYYPSAK